jgi:hypothetical protein
VHSNIARAVQRIMGRGPEALFVSVLAVAAVLCVYVLARSGVVFDRFTIGQTSARTSKIDGLNYRVHEGHLKAQEAADRMALLNDRVIALLRHLRTRYWKNGEAGPYPKRRAAVARLLARYNPDNLVENSPRNPGGESSYVENKGAIVAICLREKGEAGDLHNLEVLTFVTLHEMAHIAVDVKDHPQEFWEAFRFLLEEAEAAGIYTGPDYGKRPVRYCGVLVDYSPRWDQTLEALGP